MDWMYNKNPNEVDPEEYLLGRAIDKNYLKQPSPENYMRSVKSEASSYSQTDHTRKTLEDPLTLIKQKELEKKKLLLQKTHLKFPDGVPVNLLQDPTANQPDQPKSIERLIVESMKKLKYDIDIEKFYRMVKSNRKKHKKDKYDSEDDKKSKNGRKHASSDDSDSDNRRSTKKRIDDTDKRARRRSNPNANDTRKTRKTRSRSRDSRDIKEHRYNHRKQIELERMRKSKKNNSSSSDSDSDDHHSKKRPVSTKSKRSETPLKNKYKKPLHEKVSNKKNIELNRKHKSQRSSSSESNSNSDDSNRAKKRKLNEFKPEYRTAKRTFDSEVRDEKNTNNTDKYRKQYSVKKTSARRSSSRSDSNSVDRNRKRKVGEEVKKPKPKERSVSKSRDKYISTNYRNGEKFTRDRNKDREYERRYRDDSRDRYRNRNQRERRKS